MTLTTEGLLAIVAAMIGVIGMFVRLEHRLTKIETLVNLIIGSLGLCQPPSGKDTQ